MRTRMPVRAGKRITISPRVPGTGGEIGYYILNRLVGVFLIAAGGRYGQDREYFVLHDVLSVDSYLLRERHNIIHFHTIRCFMHVVRDYLITLPCAL